MDDNLSLYYIFHTAAATGNISKTAKKLYISQPAVSKAIRKLEESLDVSLFIRNSRGVRLTEEGQALYEHTKTAFDALTKGGEIVRRIHELGIGHLRIGVSTTLCKYLMIPLLKQFIREYPHIQITIQCQSSTHTMRLLQEGRLDLGLVGHPERCTSFPYTICGEIDDVFVATPEYLSNLKLREHASDIDILSAGNLMLLEPDNISRENVDEYLNQTGIVPTQTLEASTMDLLIEFAKIGLGIACVIRPFVAKELTRKELVLIPTKQPMPRRQIGFIYSADASQNEAVYQFRDFVKNHPIM